MEIENDTCDSCGSSTKKCGECGSTHVTPVDHVYGDVDQRYSGVRKAVLDASDGDTLVVVQVCWDCGATCERTLDVSVDHDA